MSRYIKILIAIIGVISSLSVYFLLHKINILNNEISTLSSNQKAFIFENNSLKTEAKVYKFTIEQLNYYNDSIIKRMNEVRKELNIKNNNVKQMQYLLSSISKKDTIIFKDTLFKDTVLKVDTIVSNKWYTLKLGLCYPNSISVNPTFISEKYIVISKKKETINPPKKFFLFRWFQKKHWIMEVNIKEKNPYINELDNKFIEIIE